MRLLDTNHASRVVQRYSAILARLEEYQDEGFAINVVIQGELEYMARYSNRAADNLSRVAEYVVAVNVFRLDERTAQIYGELKSDLFRRFGPRERAARRRFTLHDIGFTDNDLWVAATTIQHDLILVSADVDFRRIAEVCPLQTESWLAL